MLDQLDLPKGLKKLSSKDLYSIADEVREKIIQVVASNGGHLASNLGVVELTIALHAALDSPNDKILWDVGHQSYAHKILTGRLKEFSTIRQYKGLSGFIKRSESEHDIFGVGHAATSLSAALGIAKARDLKGENFAVTTVIGDASISSGESFEAINNVNTVKGPFIIILNDNEMSISQPVGVLSDHITSLRYNNLYRGFKKKAENVILRLPQIGKPLVKSVDKLLRRSKHLLINYLKIGVIYEEFGIRYLGPIDANNIAHVMGAVRYAKNAKEPVLIHVLSTKGHGYKYAEDNPTKFHGLGQFNPKTGEALKVNKCATYSDVFGESLVKFAKKNKKIVAITAAMAEGTGLGEFAKQFPERLVDVGISEEHAVTFAGGLAVEGFKPVVTIYSTFMQRSFDQVIHDIALQNLPVIFVMDRAGTVGEDGPTHHGVFDLPMMRMIPKMVVMAPKDGQELTEMLDFALKQNGPVSIRYPKGCIPQIKMTEKSESIELGKSELLIKNTKAKVLVIALGSMVEPCFEIIKDNKLEVQFVNIRFLKPLDARLLKQLLSKTTSVVTVEEGVMQGGLFGAIAELIQEAKLAVSLKGIGLSFDTFVEHGGRNQLLKDNGLDKSSILKVLKKELK